MALDPSIILGVKPVQFDDPLNSLGKVLQLKNAQQEGQLGALKMDEYKRGVEDNRGMADAYRDAVNPDGSVNRNTLYTSLAKRGLGAKLPTVQKGFADQDKALMDAEKTRLEVGITKADLGARILSGAKDQATYDAARAEAQARGLDVSRMPPQFDPEFVQTKLRETLSFKDQLEQKWKEKEYTTPKADAVLSAQTSTENNKRSVQASLANADATREVAAATKEAARISAKEKSDRDTELKLQDDYRTESKGFAETSTAMKKVLGAIETADKNPGSALAAGTAFMKLLDPNSVVRESELGMALNASGWFDRATNIANTLQNGLTMTADQKKNLKAAAGTLFDEAKAAQREVDAAYQRRAKDYGLEPKRIITDRGQNSGPSVAAAGPVKLTAASADSEYAKLPSGAEFIAPDGSRRRKP